MPFDSLPQETKPDVFSLEHFAAWIATKPRNKVYCYSAVGECLIGQYVASCGGRFDGGDFYYVGATKRHVMKDDELQVIARGTWNGSYLHKQTFGTALTHARKLLAKRQS